MVSDRPRTLKIDGQNRPHCEDGPFCEWSDGTKLYAWHGVRVPCWVIEHPALITLAAIKAERNIEVRRVMLERFGRARYIQELGATPIQSDKYGTLYRVDVENDEPIVMVRVTNSTPEPDGTAKEYFLSCHPELRPLLGRGPDGQQRFGDPQEMTAHAAGASTSGRRAEEYSPILET